MKECIVCKKKYEPNSNVQKCCSKECFNINKYQVRQLYHKTDKRKQSLNRYQHSDKKKECMKRFLLSEKGKSYPEYYKKYNKEYRKTDAFKRIYLICQKRYMKTNAYRKALKKYKQSEKGKRNILLCSNRRREAKYNSIHTYTFVQWKQKVEACKGICPCCYCMFDEGKYKLSLDHTPSLAEANKKFKLTGIKQVYTIKEIQPLCLRCNIIKNDRHLSIEELRKIVMQKNNEI